MAIELATKTQKEKAKSKKKSSAYRSSLAFLILSIITTIFAWLCALGNFATILVVLPLAVVLLFVVLIPSAFTLFCIWISEGYRDFVKRLADLIGQVGEKTPEILQTIFPYIAGIAAAFAITAFVLNLIFYIKKKDIKGLKGKFITSCVFLGLTIIAIILGAIFIYAK